MATESLSRGRNALPISESLLLIGLIVVALYFGRDILIPLAMALTLSFLLTPVVLGLERIRLRRVPAVIVVVVISFGIIGAAGWVVASQLLGVVNDLPNYRDNIHDKIDAIHAPTHGPLSKALESVKQIGAAVSGEPVPGPLPESPANARARHVREASRLQAQGNSAPTPVVIVTPPSTERAYLRELLLPVLRPLGTMGMVLIFTIYMLLKREDLRNRVLLLAGMGRLNVMSQALNDAAERISHYLVLNVLVNAGYGVVFGVALYLLHVPNATLWGVLAGVLRMVPYIGTLIGAACAIAFTIAVFPGWWHPFYVALIFGVMEVTVANLFEPWLYGSHTGVSALALVTMALIWTSLWGWAGLVLSTPLTVCLIVLGRYVPQMSFLNILLGEEAELSPEAQFYERLLSMDQAEAHAIADRFLEGRGVVELYDGVVLPALILAEQDRHKGELEDSRAAFLFQSATELVAELTDYRGTVSPELENESEDGRAGKGCPVVCIAASDEADELAASMFAQLLEQCEHKTLLLPASAVTEEILDRLAQERETIVCVSALPPFAFVHARNLCQQLRHHLPKNRILVALWGAVGEGDPIRQRFGTARPDYVVTTLRQGLAQIRECDAEAQQALPGFAGQTP